jgi:hypothetical protein
MRFISRLLVHAAVLSSALIATNSSAQGTAFTYQGRLNSSGAAVNGLYNLTFRLHDTNVGGSALGSLTNNAVAVSSGLFTTVLDFGGVPDGRLYWLELGVRTNGIGSFTTLAPRQALSPTPYAMFANTASNLAGVLKASQLSGTIEATNIGNGSIRTEMLAAGAALSNLTTSGQSAVPSGGIILSSNRRQFTSFGRNSFANVVLPARCIRR